MTIHASLTGANLHESKGVATATSGQVDIADGAGSQAWTTPRSVWKNNNYVTLNAYFADVSTPGSVFVVCPIAGFISKIYTVISNAITVADCGVSAKIAGVAVTSSAITITQSGSAAGDVDSSSPSAARTVVAGQAIEIVTDGASTTACPTHVTLLIDVT